MVRRLPLSNQPLCNLCKGLGPPRVVTPREGDQGLVNRILNQLRGNGVAPWADSHRGAGMCSSFGSKRASRLLNEFVSGLTHGQNHGNPWMQKSIKPAKGRWFCFPPARHPRGGNWWQRGEKGLEITWRKEIQTWKRWSSSSSRKKDIMEIGYLALGRCYPMVIVSGRVRTERNCGISPSKAQDLILTRKYWGEKAISKHIQNDSHTIQAGDFCDANEPITQPLGGRRWQKESRRLVTWWLAADGFGDNPQLSRSMGTRAMKNPGELNI